MFVRRSARYRLVSSCWNSDLNHSINALFEVAVPPPNGVAVAVGVSVGVSMATGVAVAVSVASSVSVAVAVAVSVASWVPVAVAPGVSVAWAVPVGIAVNVSTAVLVAGVADRDGTFQPFGMCGWTTIPTAICLP